MNRQITTKRHPVKCPKCQLGTRFDISASGYYDSGCLDITCLECGTEFSSAYACPNTSQYGFPGFDHAELYVDVNA